MYWFAANVNAKTYYVISTGNDNYPGSSSSQAWASIDKVNNTLFNPGDTILFEGSSSFEGGIYFWSMPSTPGTPCELSGTADKPIVFSSYGTGQATINSDTVAGFKVYNGAGFVVKNLNFEGAGWKRNKSYGIEFYMDIPDTILEFLLIDSVEVFGYRETGISINSGNQKTGGFKDVKITNSIVHDNGDAGIVSLATGIYPHKKIYVGYNQVYNNRGLPSDEKWWQHSGDGIVLGGVDGAIIEYCEAYNNGGNNQKSTGGGPYGIWGYGCNNLIIQFNESHHNRTGTPYDGGGFDLEGCSNSIIQYNYSHDNDGPGYVIAEYLNAPPTKENIVRYNISEIDCRSVSQGALHLWSTGSNRGIQDTGIYNNTIFLSPGRGIPKMIVIDESSISRTRIFNNNFVIKGDLKLLRTNACNIRFKGNNYWTNDHILKIRWLSETYHSLEPFREKTG